MNYKNGDRVRIVSEKTESDWNPDGEMDCWLDSIMTVRNTNYDLYYRMEEDNGEWLWGDEMIAGLADEPPKPEVKTIEEVVDELYDNDDDFHEAYDILQDKLRNTDLGFGLDTIIDRADKYKDEV